MIPRYSRPEMAAIWSPVDGARRGRKAMQQIAFAVLMLAASMQSAAAGDASRIAWAGFSPDGRYFAFEQDGEADAGSGDPRYGSTSVIDVALARHVEGSPVGWGGDQDEKTTEKERRVTAARVKALLKKTEISKQGLLTAKVRQARSREMTSGIHVEPLQKVAAHSFALPSDWFGSDARLVLRERKMAYKDCEPYKAQTVGFSLVLERKGYEHRLSRDEWTRLAYGCPLKYGIAEANALRLQDGSLALAVMIQHFTPGFEGPNRSFQAVTALIPSQARPE